MKTSVFQLYIGTAPDEYTMAQLAELLGYSPAYLSRIRHGHAPITDSFITRCCRELGHTIDELFEKEEE